MPENNGVQSWLSKLGESYSQIKFGPGVVGKTSYATIALFILWAIVLIRLSGNAWLDIVLLFGAIVATCIYIWWVRKTQAFAENNPELALLEGAQFVEYQKWQAQAKGLPLLPASPPVIDPNAPALIGQVSQEPDK
jgi:hypothetical protein